AGDAAPWGVLTGDTLFVGDVGRPDLLTSVGWTADGLARRLYSSLRGQLLTLPDETRVFPAHGAGSACGKSMSDAVSSTIGEQRRLNYALRPMSEDEFVEAVTQNQSVAPLYFAFTADANRHEHALLDGAEVPAPLDSDEIARLQQGGAVSVGLGGRFAEYAGDVLRPGETIVLTTGPGREAEAKVRLARIGFDRVAGAVADVERVLTEH